jgi:hypothetical protein
MLQFGEELAPRNGVIEYKHVTYETVGLTARERDTSGNM